jgi:HrpA-like RNA helicase
LMYTVEHNDVTVVVGETGCGKSTKIPQYLSDIYNQICVTLPR